MNNKRKLNTFAKWLFIGSILGAFVVKTTPVLGAIFPIAGGIIGISKEKQEKKKIKEMSNKKENREKLKELEIEYNNKKIYKKFWLIYFITIFTSTIILVPFVEIIPLIIGILGATAIGGVGTFIEINKEEKQKHLQEEIRNLKSKIMWEPNEDVAKNCAERTVEFILGTQKYTLPQLEQEENQILEKNQNELTIDKKAGIGNEKVKTYDLNVGNGNNKK